MSIAQESSEIAIWLHEKIDGLVTSSEERYRASGTCFDVVLEHQASIAMLLHREFYASSYALVRCVFEAYVRGLWLAYSASEKEVSDYLKGKCKYNFQELIDQVESVEAYSSGVISETKTSHWRFLNGLTHTGAEQILRRNTEDYIEPNYEKNEIVSLARFVNSLALLAGLEIVNLGKSRGNMEALESEFASKITEYSKKP